MRLKKIIYFMLLSLFFLNNIAAQEKSIKVFNEQRAKQITIKENKRIKIKTFDGIKVSGRIKIIDDQTILLGNKEIKLSEIEKIKRNPLIISICSSVLLYYCSAALSITSITLYAFSGDASAFLFIIPSTAFGYAGMKFPNILKGYKTSSNWKYKIIESK
ncbi:hypothetical protein Q4Q35_12570 [Flavivirga aquimarina]|uniref:Uncharacterized protein n=1 Tax=Flavivirga aquimarina TaxID=2027862 RepID=A0ABT8WC60_9FLAO|nr:hypothetical protein [Flavivirga aquimarina]MDO5970643.1 hypothetical protein [Flavivirga aquimarina]